MVEELDAAIDILTANRTNNFNASSDVIFGGNVEKWCRYANSLKLRLAMRMSYADPAYAQQKAEEAASHPIGTMASAGDIARRRRHRPVHERIQRPEARRLFHPLRV